MMVDQTVDLAMLMGILDEAAGAAYRAMRAVGLSIDAAKDAITVHVSDRLVPLAQLERESAEGPGDGGDPVRGTT